jgi:hypothetical protein
LHIYQISSQNEWVFISIAYRCTAASALALLLSDLKKKKAIREIFTLPAQPTELIVLDTFNPKSTR